jgi:hypothetical protein
MLFKREPVRQSIVPDAAFAHFLIHLNRVLQSVATCLFFDHNRPKRTLPSVAQQKAPQ